MSLFGNITSPSEELNTCPGPAAAPTPLTEELEQAEDSSETLDGSAAPKDKNTMPMSTTLGGSFVAWLQAGINSRKIIINDAKALVHTVDDTAMLVTPGIFKRYVLEHPELERQVQNQPNKAWQLVQRAFEKEKLHQKTPKKLNIWTFNVVGPRNTKQLKGYLLLDPKTLFNELPLNNPSLSRIAEGGPQNEA